MLRYCAVLMAAILISGCRAPVTESQQFSTDNPLFHDIGVVLVDGTESEVATTFKIHNTSSLPIAIQSIRKSFSCTDVTVTPDVIPAGGDATVVMKTRLAGKIGRQRLSCELVPDKGSPWLCEAAIDIRKSIELDPPALSIPQCGIGEIAKGEFRVRQTAKVGQPIPPLHIVGITEQSPLLADIGTTEDSVNGEMQMRISTVRVQVRDTKLVGQRYYQFGVSVGEKTNKPLDYMTSWDVGDEYVITPKQLLFSPADIRDGNTLRKLIVRRRDAGPISTTGISVSSSNKVSLNEEWNFSRTQLILSCTISPSMITDDYLTFTVTLPVRQSDGSPLVINGVVTKR